MSEYSGNIAGSAGGDRRTCFIENSTKKIVFSLTAGSGTTM